jgi:hypothetical protein
MANDTPIKEVAKTLWKEQSDENWKLFASALKKSSVKRYRIIYEPGKLKTLQDLRKSFAALYDSKSKLVTKVPIFRMDKGRMLGSTIYLKDLRIKNTV